MSFSIITILFHNSWLYPYLTQISRYASTIWHEGSWLELKLLDVHFMSSSFESCWALAFDCALIEKSPSNLHPPKDIALTLNFLHPPLCGTNLAWSSVILHKNSFKQLVPKWDLVIIIKTQGPTISPFLMMTNNLHNVSNKAHLSNLF